MKSLRRVLIANRGECACRMIRSVKKTGAHAIAAFAPDDFGLHCQLADQSVVLVGGYLDAESIVAAALEARADAVHPGWGFLSENAMFARKVADAGMIFIGPSPQAMEKAGSKAAARQCAEALGIPVLPGVSDANASDDILLAEAKKIGWPVLLKAAGGGGGRGMRVVRNETEFAAALQEAKSEALRGFGDAAIILEKYILRARHVEAQLLCDSFGNAQVCGLRDCSLQRRRQKMLEESPPPNLSSEIAKQLQDAAIQFARAIDYQGAGTVEFLVGDDSWHFLEMNARLQVEHPITEETCGLDLVAEQLRIAAGGKLAGIPPARGFAMEARVCAEDPLADFLPVQGQARLRFPDSSIARVDSGAREIETIGGEYDSMLAKVIVRGDTREETRKKLKRALSQTEVSGVQNNVAYLQILLEDADFIAGAPWTTLAEDKNEELLTELQRRRKQTVALAAAHLLWSSPFPASGFRLGETPRSGGIFRSEEEEWKFAVELSDSESDSCQVRIGEEEFVLESVNHDGECISATVNGESVRAQCCRGLHARRLRTTFNSCPDHLPQINGGTTSASQSFGLSEIEAADEMEVVADGIWIALQINPAPEAKEGGSAAEEARAPMHAVLQKIHVQAGQQVGAGEALATLSAMKMEITVSAPKGGVVSQIFFQVGDAVARGKLIVQIDDPDQDQNAAGANKQS